LLRDILKGDDPQLRAVVDLLNAANADIITLQGIDYDLENRALRALADALAEQGQVYPHVFAAPPNAGAQSGIDLDGDGTTNSAGDAQGYGRFFGAGSMAILSRFPIEESNVKDFSALLWRDLPEALLPRTENGPFPSAQAQNIQRLSSNGHWVVPIAHPHFGLLHILTFHATPPVFDGPEDRNGRRNHDEIRFWQHFLAGHFGEVPQHSFVLTGDANLDPYARDGRRGALNSLLQHPALQDPLAGQPTVTWQQTGPLRVDYILPSSDWRVINAQVMPPNPGASRHNLIWVDLTR
jgi:endonuclease/exonuclease/phosphatase family metal-dependent hydrolase